MEEDAPNLSREHAVCQKLLNHLWLLIKNMALARVGQPHAERLSRRGLIRCSPDFSWNEPPSQQVVVSGLRRCLQILRKQHANPSI